MGDHNCNILLSSLNNVNTRALLNITNIYNLKQHINEPTRVTPVSCTLIDVIFASHPDSVSCSGVSHVGISDHSLIYVFRKISLPSAVKVGSITSRCSGKELALLSRTLFSGRNVDRTRESGGNCLGNLKISIVIGFVRTSWLNRGLISRE